MERMSLKEMGASACAVRAATVLGEGGVVLYPTDTLYGLGADALSDAAVAKVRAIKGREEKKPIHAVVSGMKMAERYAKVDTVARSLAQRFWPGPLTLVLKKNAGVDAGIGREVETFGVRMPDDEFCIALAEAFGRPFTTTSANVSGMETPHSVDDILKQLGETGHIDLVVDAGPLPKRKASTVVDISGEEPVVLREGAISANEVLDMSAEMRF